jgi:hypothetical protein
MAEGQPGGIEPIYLTLEDVLELHALIVDATAVEAADQLRNKAGLESALARPETYAHYQEADIALQATVLAHGIAEARGAVFAASRGCSEDSGTQRDRRERLAIPCGPF